MCFVLPHTCCSICGWHRTAQRLEERRIHLRIHVELLHKACAHIHGDAHYLGTEELCPGSCKTDHMHIR